MIRRASDADLSAILRLAGRMWGESPALRDVPLDSDRVTHVAERLVAAGTLLVALQDGAVGFMAYIVAPNTWTGAPEASEVALYVAPEHRGEGIARELLLAAERAAAAAGATVFTAGTSLGLPAGAAEATYARAGFISTGRTYRKPLVARVAVA